MKAFEMELVREGLQLLDEGLQNFDEDSDHPMVQVIAKLVHSAILIGESLLGGN